MNVIAQLKVELVYFEAGVQDHSHHVTEALPGTFKSFSMRLRINHKNLTNDLLQSTNKNDWLEISKTLPSTISLGKFVGQLISLNTVTITTKIKSNIPNRSVNDYSSPSYQKFRQNGMQLSNLFNQFTDTHEKVIEQI